MMERRGDRARVFLFRDKSDAEKSARGGRRLETGIRNRFRYELSLFLRSRRTCHTHTYTYTCVSFSRAQVDAHACNGAGEKETARLHRVSAMQRGGTERRMGEEGMGAAGNVAGGHRE